MTVPLLDTWKDGRIKRAVLDCVTGSAIDDDGTLSAWRPAPVQTGLLLGKLAAEVTADPGPASTEKET